MLFIVRAARSMGLSAGGAGSACGCWGVGCDIDDCRGWRPGRLGAGVLMNAPGPGRWGVAGIWYAMVGGGGDNGGGLL